MNNFFHGLNSLVLAICVSLTSCGYVSDKPPGNTDVYRPDELQSCKIDIDKLSEIFKKDQKEQIRCLQENFIQFTKYVRSKNNDSVTETELNAFIRKFFEGQSDSIVKGLSLIFQLNMLLLRDEADRISRTNISPLFDLLVHVNQEAIVITEVLKEMDNDKNQGKFWELRAKFNASVLRFTESTVKIVKKSPGLDQKLNIKEFILEAGKKLGNKEINPDTIDSLIFVKRILAGGDKQVITSDELVTIIEALPKILSLCFDLYFSKNTNFASDADHARFYLLSARDVSKLIKFDQPDFELFTIPQILSLAQDYLKDKDTDVRKFEPSIVAIKSRLIGGQKNSVSLKDLRAAMDMVLDVAERNYFNNVTYNVFSSTLEKNAPIYSLPQLKQPTSYDVFSDRRVAELHKDFESIAVDIRYFRSQKDKIPTYSSVFNRNHYGFMEATFLKWLAVKLLKGYGHTNAAGTRQVSLEEFNVFLMEMKPILEEFKLWSPTPETFARNAVLLADLFQNKSNGDLEVNEVEATEYIQMILTAVEVTGKFRDTLAQTCDTGINKEDPVFETKCFNEHFFETLFPKLEYQRFFPRLNNYVTDPKVPATEIEGYLSGVEGFARDLPDPAIPVNKRDNILVIGAMLNIESTFLRFDLNRDNIIDYKELLEAFKIYKPAIIAIAKLKPSDEVYASSIFLYMVSKMEIPPTGSWMDNGKFFSFHKCVSSDLCRSTFMDPIIAKRLNIGKLLYYLVNQNPTTPAAAPSNKKHK